MLHWLLLICHLLIGSEMRLTKGEMKSILSGEIGSNILVTLLLVL